MRPIAFILSALLVAGIAAASAVFFIGDDDLEDAIEFFEDEDYIPAIRALNRLIPLAQYEELEKIYYYRARAANRLALTLNTENADELIALKSSASASPEYTEALRKISKSVSEINSELGTDFTVEPGINGGRISGGSLFYGEFATRFKGSPLLEYLDFEELEKTIASNNAAALQGILNFYKSHPGTPYITHLIKMLFEALQNGSASTQSESIGLEVLLNNFASRYPASPYTSMIRTCSGDRVNLRDTSHTGGSVVGHADNGEILMQLEKSMDTTQIGDTRDYWYRVSSLRGARGWIFGKFLNPFKAQAVSESNAEESWLFEEHFSGWSDSNTPSAWNHIDGADKTSIGFIASGNSKTATVKSPAEKRAGLFTRFNTTRLFAVESKARMNSGSNLILLAYVTAHRSGYYVMLDSSSIDVCGIRIPLDTSRWHTYRLERTEGDYARLTIDGQPASGMVKQVELPEILSNRGLYSLFSDKGQPADAEVTFIKAR